MSAIETNESPLRWGWFLAAGIMLMLLGAACILGSATATFVAVGVLGWVLIVSAVVAVVQAIGARNWSAFFLHVLSALLRGFTGYLLVRYPVGGELGLTLVLAAVFVIGGLFRAIVAATARFPLWGWSIVSGSISLLLGIVLLTGAPGVSSWFIGFFIGIDLLFDGAIVSAFAAALRRASAVVSLERA